MSRTNRMTTATTFLMALVLAMSIVSSIDAFVSPAVVTMVPQKARRASLFMVTTSTENKQQEQTVLMDVRTTEMDNKSPAVVDSASSTEKQMTTKTQQLMQQVKDAGTAGIISYALWELAFWLVSVPVVLFGYYGVMGHFPDLTDTDDLARLGAEAFAFVNFARFAVPLRIGLALSTTPWIEENIVERYMKGNEANNNAENGLDEKLE